MEGVFALPDEVRELLGDRLAEDAEELVLARRVSAEGRTRAYVGRAQRDRGRPARRGRGAAVVLRPARAPQADARVGPARDPGRVRGARAGGAPRAPTASSTAASERCSRAWPSCASAPARATASWTCSSGSSRRSTAPSRARRRRPRWRAERARLRHVEALRSSAAAGRRRAGRRRRGRRRRVAGAGVGGGRAGVRRRRGRGARRAGGPRPRALARGRGPRARAAPLRRGHRCGARPAGRGRGAAGAAGPAQAQARRHDRRGARARRRLPRAARRAGGRRGGDRGHRARARGAAGRAGRRRPRRCARRAARPRASLADAVRERLAALAMDGAEFTAALSPRERRLRADRRRRGRVPDRAQPGRAGGPAARDGVGRRALAGDARADGRRRPRPARRRWSSTRSTPGIGGQTARAVGEQLRALAAGPPGHLHHAPAADRVAGRPPLHDRQGHLGRDRPHDRHRAAQGATSSARSSGCSAPTARTRPPAATQKSC